jgi:ankyrin repeat protein
MQPLEINRCVEMYCTLGYDDFVAAFDRNNLKQLRDADGCGLLYYLVAFATEKDFCLFAEFLFNANDKDNSFLVRRVFEEFDDTPLYVRISCLINGGLDANFQDNCGNSLLHLSCLSRNADLVRLLRDLNASVLVLNDNDQYPSDMIQAAPDLRELVWTWEYLQAN